MNSSFKTTVALTMVFAQALAFVAILGDPSDAKAQSILPWRNQVEQRLRDQNS